jgi:hypothetical protein
MGFKGCNPLWLAEARRRFPAYKQIFRSADNPYMLWGELWHLFEEAYIPPYNEAMIKEIYAYADWSTQQPRGETSKDDLLTVVAVCFDENVPTNPEALLDMPRWYTLDKVLMMRDLFTYSVGVEGFAEILECYIGHPKPKKKPSHFADSSAAPGEAASEKPAQTPA